MSVYDSQSESTGVCKLGPNESLCHPSSTREDELAASDDGTLYSASLREGFAIELPSPAPAPAAASKQSRAAVEL